MRRSSREYSRLSFYLGDSTSDGRYLAMYLLTQLIQSLCEPLRHCFRYRIWILNFDAKYVELLGRVEIKLRHHLERFRNANVMRSERCVLLEVFRADRDDFANGMCVSFDAVDYDYCSSVLNVVYE